MSVTVVQSGCFWSVSGKIPAFTSNMTPSQLPLDPVKQ